MPMVGFVCALRCARSVRREFSLASDRSDKPAAPDSTPETSGTPAPQIPPAPSRTSDRDDVLAALSEFESGVESLKKLYTERQQVAERIEQQQQVLAGRERDLAERGALLDKLDLTLQDQRADLGRQREALEADRAGLAKAKADFEALRVELENRAADSARDRRALDRAIAEHQELEQAITQRLAGLEQREAALAKSAAELAARDGDLSRREQDLQKSREALEAEARSLREAREETERIRDESQREVARARAEIETEARALAEARGVVESDGRVLEQLEESLSAREKALDARQAELTRAEAAFADQRAELDRARSDHAHRAHEAAGDATLAGDVADRIAQAEARLTSERETSARLREELEAITRTAEQARAELETERGGRESEAAEALALRKQLADAQRHVADLATKPGKTSKNAEVESARTRVAELEGQLADALATAASSEQSHAARLKVLTDQLAEAAATRDALARKVAECEENIRRLTLEAEAGAKQAFELGEKLRQAESTLELERRNAESLVASVQECEELRRLADQLKERLRSEAAARKQTQQKAAELEQHVAALQSSLAERGGEQSVRRISSEFGAARALRRERMKLHRRLRKEQLSKVRKASEALRKRFEICEQVLSQRATLASAHQVIMETQRKLQKSRATTRVAVVMFFSAAALAVLAALCWAAAGQILPGRFIATAVVAADPRGRELSPAELREWQQFHEAMFTNPQFMERAAEHFRRFRVETLGTPGALTRRLEEDLSYQSAVPGELQIELRGQGRERTARELNALTTKLVSEALAARERRVDGAVTVIKREAAAGAEPIDEQRLTAAGLMLAGCVFVSLIVSLMLWKRLASAKQKFERDIALEAILDPSRWPEVKKEAEAA